MTANYLAVIGDVVQSRATEDRQRLQDRLTQGLGRVNQQHEDAVAARFVLTLGDEYQGLMSRSEPLIQLLAQLRAAAHPAELRFGLGIGPLHTELQPEALGMDGPCFHRARAAIERARELGTPVEAETPEYRAVLEVYSLLYGELRGRWTTRQRQVHDLSMSGLDGQTIAETLGISPSAVSQHLRATGRPAVESATERWHRALGDSMQRSQKESNP